jgi:hypothetical protein
MTRDPHNGGPTVTEESVPVDRLTAECPTHGTVPVHCPRCLGRRGGKRHKGTTWKRKMLHKDIETARRLLDIQPEARVFEQMAEARKKIQSLGARMGWSKDEVELLFTQMQLDGGIRHLRQLCDRMGMSPEERARECEDMQRTIALALGSD